MIFLILVVFFQGFGKMFLRVVGWEALRGNQDAEACGKFERHLNLRSSKLLSS